MLALTCSSPRLVALLADETPRSVGVHNTDGLLVFAGSLGEAGLRHCHELGLPIVLIHQSPPSSLDIPCVTVENKAASHRLITHLISAHGRRRIAFLRGPEAHEDSYWREVGYRQALEEYGLAQDPELIVRGDFDRRVARSSVRGLLAAGVALDAIYAGDDEAAVGVLEALREAGVKVPEEVSVVGFDDQRMSAYLTPALTTVRAPTEEVGRQAARQLIRLIRSGEARPAELAPNRDCDPSQLRLWRMRNRKEMPIERTLRCPPLEGQRMEDGRRKCIGLGCSKRWPL